MGCIKALKLLMVKSSVILSFALVLTAAVPCNQSVAETKMRPLSEAFAQEQSLSMYIYASERCSGLFASLYARFSNYNGAQYQAIAAKLLEHSSTMSLGAILMAKKAGLNLTMEKTTKKSLSIAKRYASLMDDYYEATGNSISPFVDADQNICMELVKVLNQKLGQ